MFNCCNQCNQFRIWVAILIFLICCASYSIRVYFSVIILTISHPGNFTEDNECRPVYEPPVDYNISKKFLSPIMLGAVMSAYDLGHFSSIMLYRLLGPALGASLTIGYSTLISAGLTCLTFAAYNFSVAMLIALRFFIGFMAGSLIPLINILIVQWSPLNERNIFGTSIFGCTVGIIITFLLSGYIMKYYSVKWVTYICGIFSFVCAFIWLIFVRDEPELHKCVTQEERRRIARNRHQDRLSHEFQSLIKVVPWRDILQSGPFRALFVLMWANTWVLCFYMNYIPLYVHRLLGYNIIQATGLASVPFLVRMIFGMVCVPLLSFVLEKHYLSVGAIRKGFTFLSHVLPGLIELVLLFSVCNKTINAIKIILVFGLNGAVIGGGLVNTADLAPHYAGTITAAMQALLCLSGALMSFIVGCVLMYFDGRPTGWTILMAINAAWYILGGTIFLIFGSGNAQHWDMVSMRHHIFRGFVAEDEPNEEDY